LQSSLAEQFKRLPLEERKKRLASITDKQCEALLYDWEFRARPNQKLPEGNWDTWLVMAGRGYGKTRTGAETVRIWVRDNPIIHIIAPTVADVHKVIVDGPAGIMAICPDRERPRLRAKDVTLLFPNGAKALLFSAEEPERLRGPQCYKLWADELAAWRYQQEAWDLAQFGLRLGTNPQAIVTTTPKPTKLVKELRDNPRTYLTRGTTYENRSNLADKFFRSIISKYEGTRLGRQEIDAEVLEDNPGALWKLASIDADRIQKLPDDLERIVIAIDPPATSDEDSDECGIVAAAKDRQRPAHYYVFDDRSQIASPDQWARVAVQAYKQHRADRIIGEVNNGGEMVEAVIRHVDPNVSYRAVHASRGKIVRAEPIAALYEQHRVHHVGSFGKLEDQMCNYDPATADFSPDRMDAMVWALTELSDKESGFVEYWNRQKANEDQGREPEPIAEVKKAAAKPEPGTIKCPHCKRTSTIGQIKRKDFCCDIFRGRFNRGEIKLDGEGQ